MGVHYSNFKKALAWSVKLFDGVHVRLPFLSRFNYCIERQESASGHYNLKILASKVHHLQDSTILHNKVEAFLTISDGLVFLTMLIHACKARYVMQSLSFIEN